MYRFWDGRQWSNQLSADPSAPAPGTAPGPAASNSGYGAAGYGRGGYGQSGTGHPGTGVPGTGHPGTGVPGGNWGQTGAQFTPAKKSGGALWWILGGVLVVALIAGAVLVVPQLLTGRSVLGGGNDPGGGSTPQSLCPPEPTEFPSESPVTTDGRVHAGNMSYPELGAPWSAPIYDSRVPFGRDVATQVIQTEESAGVGTWQAGVLIAELAAGDGFFSPEQGSDIVTECIVGSFYGDADVTRDDHRNEEITIDGHEGWIVESTLSFDIPEIRAKSELLIVVIVRTTETKSALYFASIPENVPEYEQPARDLVEELRVDS